MSETDPYKKDSGTGRERRVERSLEKSKSEEGQGLKVRKTVPN